MSAQRITPPIEVLVLDLDDTLYLERDFVRSGLQAVDSWLVAQHRAGGFFVAAWARFAAGQRRMIFDTVLPTLGLEPSPGRITAMLEIYRCHRPDIQLLPDSDRLMRRLHGRLPLALVTDGFLVTQRAKIDSLNLAPWLEPIICTDEFGQAFWKPHRHAFELIQNRYGRPGSAFCYVADNPHKDFIAPRALGWQTVRIARPGGLHAAVEHAAQDADSRVESLDELLPSPRSPTAGGASIEGAATVSCNRRSSEAVAGRRDRQLRGSSEITVEI